MGVGDVFWLTLGFTLALAPWLFSWLVGNWHQNKIKGDLLQREKSIERDPMTTLRNVVGDRPIASSGLIFANVVGAPSWWQLWLAKWKSVFGGNIKSLDKMLDWSRSEAIQRLREMALAQGFDEVINMRIETSQISVNKGGKQKGGSLEIVAYGTGIKYA